MLGLNFWKPSTNPPESTQRNLQKRLFLIVLAFNTFVVVKTKKILSLAYTPLKISLSILLRELGVVQWQVVVVVRGQAS